MSPAQLEDAIRAHPMVSQCLVVGDNKPFIGALITIDPEATPAGSSVTICRPTPGWPTWPETPNCAPRSPRRRRGQLEGVQAEAIKKFEILDTDFTIESGELTPTMKLKRNVISDTYKQAIADLYT